MIHPCELCAFVVKFYCKGRKDVFVLAYATDSVDNLRSVGAR